MEYDIEWEHIRDTENTIADTLSRSMHHDKLKDKIIYIRTTERDETQKWLDLRAKLIKI